MAVVAGFYPSLRDPVLGIWAHRQALAAREAGAEIQVLVLHRLVPPRASLADGPAAAAKALAARVSEPVSQQLDGLPVTYVPYASPPRERFYPAWGRWAATPLGLALRRLRRSFAFELVHAHNAVPAADAVRIAAGGVPLIVSVHGGDVLHTALRGPSGAAAVRRGLGAAQLVLANSQGIAELAQASGARETRVVHLGADLPPPAHSAQPGGPQSLVTVGHLVARKRQADVLRALAVLGPRHPQLRYMIIGDGPERGALEALARRLEVAGRVEFLGQLEPAETLRRARTATLFVMPSTEEAFGVAYVEAMAAGIPAIGCRGEPGPEEIAAAGDGLVLVPPGDIERLTQRIDELLSDAQRLREAGRAGTGHRRRELHLGALRCTDGGRLPRHRAVKPLLFLTGNVPAYRVGALACLHDAEGIEVATFGGPSLHGGPASAGEPPFPHRQITPAQTWELASSGAYRGSSAPQAGRLALLGGWAGARRAGVPLILWASLWAHPRSAAHALSYPLLHRLYGSADAVVTYGPHVSAYVAAHGARNIHIAPQSVDNSFWARPPEERRSSRTGLPPRACASSSSAGMLPRRGSVCCAQPGRAPDSRRHRRPSCWSDPAAQRRAPAAGSSSSACSHPSACGPSMRPARC